MMQRSGFSVMVLARMAAGALLLTYSALAQAKDEDELCQWLSDAGSVYLSETGGPGMVVGIVEQGKMRCAQGFGVIRKGSGQPVTVQTNFHMASASKPFVATAIVKLISDRRINLDAPVTRYIPTFRLADAHYRKITIRHLLNHTSGLPDVEDYGWDKPERDDEALARYVASLKSMKLRSSPGARFYYSNIGFEVLGVVIARASGQSFEDYVQTKILQSSAMGRSSFIYTPGTPTDQATGHIIDDSGQRVISEIYPFSRRHGPSSTLQSNAIDMGRWVGQMLGAPLDGELRLLSNAEAKLLFGPLNRNISKDTPDRIPPKVKVALSWFLAPYKRRVLITHPGADDGFASLVVFDPVCQIGIVMMTNADQDEPDSVARADGLPNAFGFGLVTQILDRLATEQPSKADASTLHECKRSGVR